MSFYPRAGRRRRSADLQRRGRRRADTGQGLASRPARTRWPGTARRTAGQDPERGTAERKLVHADW